MINTSLEEVPPCAAYSRPFKLLALGIVGLCTSWMAHLWEQEKIAANFSTNPSNGLIWIACGQLLLLYTLIAIYRSRTSLQDGILRQSWIWDKEVAIRDIAYAKLIHLKGFEWFIAPRLYVRTVAGKFYTFYTADERMLAIFKTIPLRIQSL